MTLIRHAIAVLILAFGATDSFAQQPRPDRLAPVAALVGDWTGVGEGQPGTSAATRHTERVHGGRFIRVEGRSVYPKQEKNKSGETHTSTDLWSYDQARKALVLRQFDSLGFVSTYVQDVAASRDGHVVLVSEHLENVPAGWKARYTYDFPAPDEYRELFELDPTGKGFETYVSGRYLRDRRD
jgi:hypothetical protein